MKTVALLGNPNSGKTTVFNQLTGESQRVGNWPGVTVERKIGRYKQVNQQTTVVDLPGSYSLSVLSDQVSLDERIACDYLLTGEADIIVNVVDASNLERNLYLTLQLLEFNVPVIVALNMTDIAKQRGLTLDVEQLSQQLQCPVVSLQANKNHGIEQLKQTINNTTVASAFVLAYPQVIEQALVTLAPEVSHSDYPTRWLAVRLLEEDAVAKQQVTPAIWQHVKRQQHNIRQCLSEDADILIADARYRYISRLLAGVCRQQATLKQTVTHYIDHIALHRFFGIPLFLLIMYIMFVFSVNVGGAFQDLFDKGSAAIFVQGLSQVLIHWHAA